MIAEKYIYKSFFSLVLILVLMMPTATQFSHLFEDHEHQVCSEQSIHFHEASVDCKISLYSQQSFSFNILNYTEIIVVNYYNLISTVYTSVLKYTTVKNIHLRGPPSLS